MRIIGLVPPEGPEDTAGVPGDTHDLSVTRELLTSGCLDEVLLTTGTDSAVTVPVSTGDILLVHDTRLDLAARETIRSVVELVRTGAAAAAIATRPVTDTIKLLEPGGTLRSTWERHRLRELRSPLCCRAGMVGDLGKAPGVSDLPAGSIRLVPDEEPAAGS